MKVKVKVTSPPVFKHYAMKTVTSARDGGEW
jgi:hypothetical protein